MAAFVVREKGRGCEGGGGAAEPPSRRLRPAARAGDAAHRRIERAGEREIEEGEGREEDEVVEEDEGNRGARLAPGAVAVALAMASGGCRREQPAACIGRDGGSEGSSWVCFFFFLPTP